MTQKRKKWHTVLLVLGKSGNRQPTESYSVLNWMNVKVYLENGLIVYNLGTLHAIRVLKKESALKCRTNV